MLAPATSLCSSIRCNFHRADECRGHPHIIQEALMSADEARSNAGNSSAKLDMKLEVVVIPVSDVDRAKDFYAKLGWRLDADFAAGNDFRVVQFTPPGSGCS